MKCGRYLVSMFGQTHPRAIFLLVCLALFQMNAVRGEPLAKKFWSASVDDFMAMPPGCTSTVLTADPPGYYVSTLVVRYFDDEQSSDLHAELELTARQQFLRFVAFGLDEGGPTGVGLNEFQAVRVWWDGDAFLGLYRLPMSGVSRVANAVAGEALGGDGTLNATELLLKARRLRGLREFQSARAVLARLREEYPLSPEARRAVRELFFLNTAEAKLREGKRGDE